MNTDFTEYYGCGVTPQKKTRVSESTQTASLELFINRIEELASEKVLLLKSQSDYNHIKKEWTKQLEENSKLKEELTKTKKTTKPT